MVSKSGAAKRLQELLEAGRLSVILAPPTGHSEEVASNTTALIQEQVDALVDSGGGEEAAALLAAAREADEPDDSPWNTLLANVSATLGEARDRTPGSPTPARTKRPRSALLLLLAAAIVVVLGAGILSLLPRSSDLEPGDCVRVGGEAFLSVGGGEHLQATECGQLGVAEVVFSRDASGDPFPGDLEVLRRECLATPGTIAIVPSAESWEDGDRNVLCLSGSGVGPPKQAGGDGSNPRDGTASHVPTLPADGAPIPPLTGDQIQGGVPPDPMP